MWETRAKDKTHGEVPSFNSLSFHTTKAKRGKVKTFFTNLFYAIIAILILMLFVAFIAIIKDGFKDQEKIVAVELPGDRYVGMKIIECRYPLGSIFNKDEMIIGSNGLAITTRSIWGCKTKTLPYTKIKQIEFVESIYWKSFTARGEGFLGIRGTLYFKEYLTKETIKGVFRAIAPDMIVIEEQTASYKMREYFGRTKQDPLGIRE